MKLLFLLTFLTVSYTLFSQDTTTVEQYCEVVVTTNGSSIIDIIMDYGHEGRHRWSGYKNEKGKYVKYSIIDALNYMGKQGWKLVNTITIPLPSLSPNELHEYHYFFKKDMLRSAMNDQRTN